ncbi:T9SS type A sorting domain-containing protein [Pedobacter sp. SD-b]|uniref:T9SS type A sorting domain-containing protein n=1 Tax=Pedobacter segetis TaxID=2793069 RepID=A0ABS1BPC1_9SPHI|nr:T9SS type A sorting domain-containing protein [Pedobacter segetis]MBK0384266.1 T9SS type A sorting domain-containing protein [Pedobacter segetis]
MKKLLLSLILVTVFVHAKAQWAGETPIVTSSNTTSKTGLISINDGSNNMIIAWVDARNSATTGNDIYIQKINNDGTLPWGTEKVVCNAIGSQTNMNLISDGAGGAIVVWEDPVTSSTNKDIYGQHITASGATGWAANGVILTNNTGNTTKKFSPIAEKVSATEFMVVWKDDRDGTQDLYAQKCLISTGAPQWAADVSIHGNQANIQTGQVLLKDGLGGCFVVWADPRLATNNSDIYAQRIKNDGTLLWGASGTLICGSTSNQLNSSISTDNKGGFIVTWGDLRAGSTDGNIYAQRLNSNGVAGWATNGVLICSAANSQLYPKIVTVDSSFVIAWTDPRISNSDNNIYAQKIDTSGVTKWDATATAEGVPVVTATGNQGITGDFTLDTAGNGKVIISFSDKRGGTDYDIYAQELKADGSSVFGTNGVIVSSATGDQRYPTSIVNGNGGLLMAWGDSRNSSNGDIYAANLKSDGTLPVKFTTITASLNSNQTVLVKWGIASEINTQKYIVERRNDKADFQQIGEVAAKNLSNYQFTDHNPLLGTNYYRIKAVDFDATLSLSAIATIKTSSLAQTLATVYPNPIANVLNISLSGATSNNYHLKIFDLKGAIKLDKNVDVDNGNITLKVDGLETGVFTLQLLGNDGNVKLVQKIVKL